MLTNFITKLLFLPSTLWSTGNSPYMFPKPGNTLMSTMVDLHHDIMFFISFIVFFVLTILILIGWNSSVSKLKNKVSYSQFFSVTHNDKIEIIWTILPALILFCISFPSFLLLYLVEENYHPSLTVKVTGHQWYWIYEYHNEIKRRFKTNFLPEHSEWNEWWDESLPFFLDPAEWPLLNNFFCTTGIINWSNYSEAYNTYMPADKAELFYDNTLALDVAEDIVEGIPYAPVADSWVENSIAGHNGFVVNDWIEAYSQKNNYTECFNLWKIVTQNVLTLPTRFAINLLVTANDVIHSWAVPALGVKVDACPGRLNIMSFEIALEGTYFGQCSEICGINHSYMPIYVNAVTVSDYLSYYSLNPFADSAVATLKTPQFFLKNGPYADLVAKGISDEKYMDSLSFEWYLMEDALRCQTGVQLTK